LFDAHASGEKRQTNVAGLLAIVSTHRCMDLNQAAVLLLVGLKPVKAPKFPSESEPSYEPEQKCSYNPLYICISGNGKSWDL
jgi:hypothetical protein